MRVFEDISSILTHLVLVPSLVRLMLRTELRGGLEDRSRRGTPPAACNCGRRAAVTLGGFLSRLGRRANGLPPRQFLCGAYRRSLTEDERRNNTVAGAHTQQVLMTILHTGRKRGSTLSLSPPTLRDPSSVDAWEAWLLHL